MREGRGWRAVPIIAVIYNLLAELLRAQGILHSQHTPLWRVNLWRGRGGGGGGGTIHS